MSTNSHHSTMSPCLVVLLLMLSSCQLVRVASYRLTISPDHVKTSKDPQTVTFTCTADTALAGCQFRWLDVDRYARASPLLELSRGSESRANSDHLNSDLTGYSYSGRGLWAGDCGVSLQVKGWKVWMVACRVRAETGGWTYAWADLFADHWLPLPLTLTPRQSVVLPGGEARFTLKAQEPLRWCSFYRSDFNLRFSQGAQSRDSTGRHRYLGGGLGGGECGLALTNVIEADNGQVTSYIINTAWTKFDYRFMALIVARRPSAPSLTVVQENNSINATCVVENSRPLPQITWLLGDDVIRQDALEDTPGSPQDEWRWPWMQGSLMQRVTLRQKSEANGKTLKCRISHVTLDEPLEVNERILFQTSCPPLASHTTTIACYSGGQEVDCARPQPIGSWAEVACKPGYTTSQDVTDSRINCAKPGEWDRPVFACRPDCGSRKTNQGQPDIYGGKDAEVGEFPWHVAIYENGKDSYTLICGGSLISTRIVISAAHCFWNDTLDRKKDSVYQVAAGKHKRAWLDAEDDDQVQRRRVELITIPQEYHGRSTNFQADIALVRLSAQVDITANVNLVCVDWENLWEASQLQQGNNGTVAGWGYTEQGLPSRALQYVDLPYIDHSTCYHGLDRNLKRFMTIHTFCAGYVHQSISVCPGDSGGGLVFLRESSNRYYLRGVVSIALSPFSRNSPSCYAQMYTAFTRVSNYNRWVRDHLA